MDPPADKVFYRVCTQSYGESKDDFWQWAAPLVSEIGLLSQEVKVRHTVLQALAALDGSASAPCGVLFVDTSCVLQCLLWMLRFDENEMVAGAAKSIWAGKESQLTERFDALLRPMLSHPFAHVRLAAAKAIAGALTVPAFSADTVVSVIRSLQEQFVSLVPAKREIPGMASSNASVVGGGGSSAGISGTGSKKGAAGASALAILSRPGGALRSASAMSDDKHGAQRLALANVFVAIGSQGQLSEEITVGNGAVISVLEFLLKYGVVDTNSEVSSTMLTAGRTLIDSFGGGADLCSPLMRLLEGTIATKYSGAPNDEAALAAFDSCHSAAVVLLGATGRHLSKEDPAVGLITQSLIEALKTPSEGVQRAVAECLVPLIQSLKGQEIATTILETLMDRTLNGSTYGERKGAAFGLSAFVKGSGIPSLKAHDIVPRLKEACANGSTNARQGALFAFECLSSRLGLLFEPYIIAIIEVLLKSFSHSSDHVREAAQDAARVIMNKLSAHGVKQVLTPILASLPNEAAWKSRQESIRLLGMMAHCAPKQLASSLPQIVPSLMLAGSDPHPKVKESAKAALMDISSGNFLLLYCFISEVIK
jgi:HEAT repeat protein